MSSVHGITVFGGTFPAEIWNSLYSAGGVPCEEFTEPEQSIQWAPYYGQFRPRHPRATAMPGTGAEIEMEMAERPRRGPPRSAAMTRTPTRPVPGRIRRRFRPPTNLPRRAASAAASRPAEPGSRDRPRARLRPRLGRLPRLPRVSLGGPAARRAARLGRDRDPRRRLRGGPGAALPRRLQLRRLRPARGRPRARPLRPRTRCRALRPRLRRRHLDRSDQRLRPAVHARDLPARLAAGRSRGGGR